MNLLSTGDEIIVQYLQSIGEEFLSLVLLSQMFAGVADIVES
jgi:hypothetical protein